MQLGSCCEGCDNGGPCEGGALGEIPAGLEYDAVPFDAYNNEQQPMAWNEYPPDSPFVYADSLGRGGATQLRYAQTPQGSSAMMGDADTGSGELWQRQLGQIPAPPLPPCPEGYDEVFGICVPTLTTPPPGTMLPVLTEEQCAVREQSAFERGRTEERRQVITTAVITAVASGLVGVGIGYIFRR